MFTITGAANRSRFQFEMKLRRSIIDSAKLLNHSGVSYAVFKDSYCNPTFWILQANGGFKLKPEVVPSEAIRDIYANSTQYAFECATAMVIVYYKAVLEVIDENQFNQMFRSIILWDWLYDEDLHISTIKTKDFIPGDVLYFANPDVSPLTREWQGENVVYLSEHSYYGHGIGIKNAQEIIDTLNQHRKPDATQSAHLLDQATRPGFQFLSQFDASRADTLDFNSLTHLIPVKVTAKIGSKFFFAPL